MGGLGSQKTILPIPATNPPGTVVCPSYYPIRGGRGGRKLFDKFVRIVKKVRVEYEA